MCFVLLLLYIIVSTQSTPTSAQNIWAIHNLRILLPRCDIVRRLALSTPYASCSPVESDLIKPSYETKRILTFQEVDESYISGGQLTWPFVTTPPLLFYNRLHQAALIPSSASRQL